MSDQTPDVISGSNFAAARSGPFDELDRYTFDHPAFSEPVPGKCFLNDLLGLTGMEVSLNKLPPGAAVPFYHVHDRHEELYIVVRGTGRFQVDHREVELTEGMAIRIAPDGKRTLRNSSTDEPLCFICIQAEDGALDRSGIEDGIPLEEEVVWND